jgi:hypothetical protein
LFRDQAELENEVQIQFQIGRTSFSLSDGFKFSGAIDPGEKLQCLEPGAAACGFGWWEISYPDCKVSEINRLKAPTQLQTAPTQLQTAHFCISHFSGPREVAENEDAVIEDAIKMMEFGDDLEGEAFQLDVEDPKMLLLEAIENAKENIKEIVKNGKVSLNERKNATPSFWPPESTSARRMGGKQITSCG